MLTQDLRYAIRGFIKRPGFAVIAIVTLSLGIGATTAIFSVVQAVLLRPLEYPQADRLVKLVGFDKDEGITGNLSPADFLDFERDNTSFARMGANGWVGPGDHHRRARRSRTRRRRAGHRRFLCDAAGAAGDWAARFSRRRSPGRASCRCSSATVSGAAGYGADPSIVGSSDHRQRDAGHGDRRAAGGLPPPRDQSRASGGRVHRCSGFDPARPTAAVTSFAASARLKDGVDRRAGARAEIDTDRRPARAAVSGRQHRPGRAW